MNLPWPEELPAKLFKPSSELATPTSCDEVGLGSPLLGTLETAEVNQGRATDYVKDKGLLVK